MLYKFVIITYLATHVCSHDYNAETHGRYGSYAQEVSNQQAHQGTPVYSEATSSSRYLPPKLRPGQSINEEKCLESVWNKKVTMDNSQNNIDCSTYRGKYLNVSDAVIGGRVAELKEFLNMSDQQWNHSKRRNARNVNSNLQRNQSNQGQEQNINVYRTEEKFQGTVMYTEIYNPCLKELPTKPSFKRPGRRISVEKCLEFIWDIKAKEDTLQKKKECRTYKRQYLNDFSEDPFIGGRLAEPGEFPHMAAIGWKSVVGTYIFKCGATIVSPKFMITAGHCTRSARDERISNPVPEIVRIGSKDIQLLYNNNIEINKVGNYPRDMKISKIIRHPCYQPPKKYFDIALLELEKNLIFDKNVQAACLWNNLNNDKIEKASAAGWGVTQEGREQTTTELRVGDLDLINKDECNQLLRPMFNRLWCGLEEHQICAGKLTGGVDTCQGDSGGPLQVQINLPSSIKGKIYYLLGVTSFGFGCARSNSPGVYTRIATFIDWIEQNVWPNEVASGNK